MDKATRTLAQRVAALEKIVHALQRAPREQNQEALEQENGSNQEHDAAEVHPVVTPKATPSKDHSSDPKKGRYRRIPWWKVLEAAGIIAVVWYAAITHLEWRDLRNNFKVDERAWVGIKDIGLVGEIAVGQPMNVIVTTVNTGKTPAQETTVINCGTGDTEAATLSCGISEEFKSAVAPNAQSVFSFKSDPVSQTYVNRLRDGVQRTYYRGTIQYRDIFGKTHQTGFCAFYPASKAVPFSACPHGGNYMN